MAHVLTRFPRDNHGRRFEVAVATQPADVEVAQRLRRRIYVEEMGMLPADHPYVHGDRLIDAYDDWSTHLLLRQDGRTVGTARLTAAADGPMELDEHIDVRPYLREGSRPAEITRFMVLRESRRSLGAPLLLYAAFRVLAAGSTTHLVAAAKVGSLGRYYRHVGLRLLDAPSFVYGLTGATYELGTIDLGPPRSLRRAGLRGLYGGLKGLGGHVSPIVHFTFRRRLSAGRDAARAPVRLTPTPRSMEAP